MGRRVLATDVNVWHDDKSAFIRLSAGSEVPEWAADLVTNPKAFVELVEDDTPASDDDIPATYAEMKNDQLKALLKARELPTSGKHDELVTRLEEDDAEKAEDDDEEEPPSGDDTPDGDDDDKE